jgi:hypothetical protein
MLRVVVPIVILAVFVYGLVDLIRTDARLTRGISKTAWIFVQILLPVVGATLWFLIGRPRATDTAPVAYSHPVAPDDDPEFLRNLEIRHRNQAEADKLKKLKEEFDAKERKLDADSADAGGTEGAGDAHEPGDAGTPGTDEVK